MPSRSSIDDIKLPGYGLPLNHSVDAYGIGGRFPKSLLDYGYEYVPVETLVDSQRTEC